MKMKSVCIVLVLNALGMLGCGHVAESPESSDQEDLRVVGGSLPGDEFAPVAASATTPNGNLVRVYDLPDGALVMEMAKTYAPSAVHFKVGEDDSLLRIWQEIVPGAVPPLKLVALENRLLQGTAQDRTSKLEVTGPDSAQAVSRKPAGGPTTMALEGCNNGCCDYDWMYQSFDECRQSYDYRWMLYNDYSTYANVSHVWWFDGMVCAAVGTSRYHLSISGYKTVDIDVAEGNFFRTHWKGPTNYNPTHSGCCSDAPLTSTVNASGWQLHTYCGGALKN